MADWEEVTVAVGVIVDVTLPDWDAKNEGVNVAVMLGERDVLALPVEDIVLTAEIELVLELSGDWDMRGVDETEGDADDDSEMIADCVAAGVLLTLLLVIGEREVLAVPLTDNVFTLVTDVVDVGDIVDVKVVEADCDDDGDADLDAEFVAVAVVTAETDGLEEMLVMAVLESEADTDELCVTIPVRLPSIVVDSLVVAVKDAAEDVEAIADSVIFVVLLGVRLEDALNVPPIVRVVVADADAEADGDGDNEGVTVIDGVVDLERTDERVILELELAVGEDPVENVDAAEEVTDLIDDLVIALVPVSVCELVRVRDRIAVADRTALRLVVADGVFVGKL